MKKLLFLFFAFGMMQVSAQDLNSLSKSGASSTSMIESLASDQVKSLTKKLNLNEKQQEQVSGLVVSQLRSDKFQKLIGSFGADKLMSSNSDQTENLQAALLGEESFQKDMSSVLDKKQMEKMKSLIPQ
ncbi:hypothetical protein OS188_02650 [Xanthomarina sp. F1114]|uniref:hypothetical protein n=1 Tax=Xanthomarina sp. F1114 TaxID=2996019 RepID=UPI00225DD370|nr:hypothetical protein [Xanthomarina sp. F1114]MCX7546847.1 hypothetical protein [Xanthomarina sp. F1114]